jgi:guanylate kinase
MSSETMSSGSSLVRKGILFVIVGPAGAGKSTVCDRLVAEFSDSLQYSTSATSRIPRPGEIAGKSYHFMSREEFVTRRDQGEFFEWEEIHGNLYGTPKDSLLQGVETGKDLLLQKDIRGALNFKRHFPDNTVALFMLPPSFSAMNSRLQARGTSDPAEVARRLATARSEYQALLDVHGTQGAIDYIVVNGDLDSTYAQVRAVVVAERTRYLRVDRDSVKHLCEVGI